MKRRILSIALTILIVILMAAPRQSLADTYGTYYDLILDTFSDNILVLYPMNETSGTTIYDISGNNRNGTYYGVALDQIDGPGATFGRSALWDGVNDYANIFTSDLANNLNVDEYTICAWARVTEDVDWNNSTYAYIVSLLGAAPIARIYKNNTAYQIRASFADGVIGGLYDISTTDWFFIAVTRSVTNNSAKTYINGNLVDTKTAATSANALNSAALGRVANNTVYYWHGYISAFMILDKAATNSEIELLADANPVLPTPTPTSTATATRTPRPPQLILTLANGNQFELDYTVTAGDIAQFIPALLLIALLVFVIILKLVRR